MQTTIKIPILDLYHDRVSMCLWPKLTSLFQFYIETLQRATPKQFRQNHQPVVHSLTQKYVQFASGVYQLCHSITSNSQDMVSHRLASLRKALSDLLSKLSDQHYLGKMSQMFLINNLHFIVHEFKQIKEHPILKEDIKIFEQNEKNAVDLYIQQTIQDNFVSMIAVIDTQQSSRQAVETAVSDFAFHYRQKAEVMGKDIRHSVQDTELAQQIGNKLMRTMCQKYAKLCEMCKQLAVGVQYPTNNQVLLDLTKILL